MIWRSSIWFIDQSREQSFAGGGQFVHRRSAQDPAFDQPGIPEDAQIAADPALLHPGDQAEITDAGLTGIGDQLEQDDPVRIGEGLAPASKFLSFVVGNELGFQAGSFAGVGDLQSRGLVSH